MRRIFTASLLAAMSVSVLAQGRMADMIISMPDTVVPYLNATKRTEMVDFYSMGVKAETYNLLSESTVLDTLNASYAHITLNESARMQLALLPAATGDTILCVVRTWRGEAPESEVDFYNLKWQKLQRATFLDPIDAVSLTARPDTMEVDRYDRLVRLIDPAMVQAMYSPNDQSITFSLATPMLGKSDREQLEVILLQRKVKWRDGKFNKS